MSIIKMEAEMTLIELIEKQINALPPEKQNEVLDFIAFLEQRMANAKPVEKHSLREHVAFGSWKSRNIDALQYQQNLRMEWGM